MSTGVSFLVTVYNRATYLPAVIKALGGQEGDFDREFIFVDDGSKDGSAEVIEAHTRGWPNLKLVRQPNRGPSGAMRRAADAATLPFLKMLDHDDLLHPKATLWLLEAHRRYRAVASFGRSGSYDVGEFAQWPQIPDPPPSRVISNPMPVMLQRSFISPSNLLLSTADYHAVGGCSPYVFTQDYSVLLKLAARGPFAAVNAPLCLKPRSAPGRASENQGRVLHDINLLLYEALAEIPQLTPAQRRYAARRATGRAYKFRRRHGGSTSLVSSALRYAIASLGLPVDPRKLIAATLRDFGVPSQLDGWRPGS